MLERLKPRAPNFGGPIILGIRTISSVFVSNCIGIFVLVQRTFFTMSLKEDLYRPTLPKLFGCWDKFAILSVPACWILFVSKAKNTTCIALDTLVFFYLFSLLVNMFAM